MNFTSHEIERAVLDGLRVIRDCNSHTSDLAEIKIQLNRWAAFNFTSASKETRDLIVTRAWARSKVIAQLNAKGGTK